MKRMFAFLLIVVSVGAVPFKGACAGGAFLVMDGCTTEVLEHENGYERLPMASTTKVMTALVVLEKTRLSDVVKIPSEAVGIEGSSLYLKQGESYTVEELLYGLMLRSANDSAVALAWYVGGGDVSAFVRMMNEKALAFGLINTRFANPNGLSADDHYTSAYDLATIMYWAMKNESFRRITSTKKKQIKDQMVYNHNKLLSLYDGCIGGKTGYTMEAGRCLVSVAERNGASLICVTLGRRDDWNLHTSAYEKWFPAANELVLEEHNGFSVSLAVAGGGTAVVKNYGRVVAKVIKSDKKIDKYVLAQPYIYGNKEPGTVVGTVEYRMNDIIVGQSPLVLAEKIEVKMKKELFVTRIFRFFRHLFLKKK